MCSFKCHAHAHEHVCAQAQRHAFTVAAQSLMCCRCSSISQCVVARAMQADYLSAVASYDPFGMFGKVQKLNVLPLFIVAVLVSKTRPERACKPTCARTHTHASENTHAHSRTRNLVSQPNCRVIKLTKQLKSVTRTQLMLSDAAFGMWSSHIPTRPIPSHPIPRYTTAYECLHLANPRPSGAERMNRGYVSR